MSKSPVTLLLAFDDQVRRDQNQSALFLHRRDRRYALDCHAQQQKPSLAGWLNHITPHRPETLQPDARIKRWQRLSRLLLPVGALLGVVTMLGLLFYDGSQQINVTVIIGFVALQGLLALLTTLQALFGWRPWGRLLTPGRGTDRPTTALDGLQPQLAACTAHQTALVFTLAGLLTLLAMIVVQDLAFGWSTTLRTSAESYGALIHGLATPWQALWPAAVPSMALIEQTQFFRLGDPRIAEPARYGDWWPFVCMLWLTYAVLPRLLLTLFARLHLRTQARRQLLRHPGRQSLLYRFDAPTVETASSPSTDPAMPHQPENQFHSLPASRDLIRWGGVAHDTDEPLTLMERDNSRLFDAGGTASLAHDQAVLNELAEREGPVILLARAWEPPTGELADFIQEARRSRSRDRLLALVPIGGEQPLTPASPRQLAQWQRFVERQKDANLWICQLPTPDREARQHG
ncbi:DUF2868 domain-containing protein [Marinobacter fonticola]|uniref:DUF2868 domain-containing protein n=1 Tax=Marinobacter fonticola TaxID=2603215 RepID=UPI0011E66D2C|nr:DUF2868 domain-containing protein [Marinobacter fonticola]